MKIVYCLLLTIFTSATASANNHMHVSFFEVDYSIHFNQNENALNTVLLELVKGINPKSFNKVWKTEGPVWIEKVKTANDVATLSSAYLTLAEKIKPKFFKPSWEKSKDKWVKQVKEARSNLALAGLLKSFYNNLLPETFTKDWPAKGTQWVETLGKIE